VGVLPVFRAVREETFFLTSDDNQQQVQWDWWEFNDETVYQEGDINGVTDRLKSWQVEAPGIYLINATINFQNAPTWDTTLILNDPYRNTIMTHSSTANAFDDYYCFSCTRDLWPFDPYGQIDPDTPPNLIEMALSVNQNSGSDQNAGYIDLLVVRIGTFDVATPTHDIVTYVPGRVINGGA
jgi:hypothetical protein